MPQAMHHTRRAMPFLLLVLCSASCATPQIRYDRFLGRDAIHLHMNAHTQVVIKRVMQRPGFVELDVDLVNTHDTQSIFIPHTGEHNSAIRLQSEGQTAIAQSRPGALGLWCGYYEGSIAAQGNGLELSPDSRLGLVMRFNWDQAIETDEPYKWSLQFGGIYELGSDQALPTLQHRYPGD